MPCVLYLYQIVINSGTTLQYKTLNLFVAVIKSMTDEMPR